MLYKLENVRPKMVKESITTRQKDETDDWIEVVEKMQFNFPQRIRTRRTAQNKLGFQVGAALEMESGGGRGAFAP